MGTNPVIYEHNTFQFLQMKDIWSGAIKAAVFGLILTLTGCVRGYYTSGGAEGVGRATTHAVVSASPVRDTPRHPVMCAAPSRSSALINA